jgi:hypothetical protein
LLAQQWWAMDGADERCTQYRGKKATLTLMGSTITGLVRSVMEDRSTNPTRWIVTIISK